MTKQEFIAKYEGWFSYTHREELKKQMESDLEAVFQALRKPLTSGSLPLDKLRKNRKTFLKEFLKTIRNC